MSGEAFGILLLPLAIAAVPVVGAVLIGGAVVGGVAAASSAASRYENEKRKQREDIRQSRVGESVGSFRNEVKNNMKNQTRLNVQASEQMMNEINRNRQEMINMLQKNDPAQYHQYMGRINESKKQLSQTMVNIQENFIRNYHTSINESMNKVTTQINNKYAQLTSELQQLKNDAAAKKAKAKQIADQYIEEAKTVLISFEEDFEAAKFSPSQLVELQRSVNDAIKQYNLENYESAIASAKMAVVDTIEEIYKADCKKQEWENYFKLALVGAEELVAYIESQGTITEEVKNQVEERIGKSLEEDIVGLEVKDYTGCTSTGANRYEYLLGKAKEIKEFLNSDQADNLTTNELKEYVTLINSQLYPEVTMTVYKGILNMSNAFSRQNISEEIISFFEDHDFNFTGYSYEDDKHDGALHIGLENDVTGEEIIVTLAPETMSNGEVQTKVSIDQLKGDETNEDRKAYYRASVRDVVVGNTPGAQIKLECKKETRNKLSSNTQLRDKLQ